MSQISLHVHIFFFCRIFFNFRCCRRVMNVNHTIGCLMTIYIHHVKPCNKILQFYMRGCFCHKATSKKLHQGVTKWCSISGSHFQRYDIYLNSQCCNLLSMTVDPKMFGTLIFPNWNIHFTIVPFLVESTSFEQIWVSFPKEHPYQILFQ